MKDNKIVIICRGSAIAVFDDIEAAHAYVDALIAAMPEESFTISGAVYNPPIETAAKWEVRK